MSIEGLQFALFLCVIVIILQRRSICQLAEKYYELKRGKDSR